ncbi:hypothetical protein CU048_14140 [Beijerinckiaceae bacterium]|nr:hypothetical protein CU048_14140 [Beijerinckiaceae bacterium]
MKRRGYAFGGVGAIAGAFIGLISGFGKGARSGFGLFTAIGAYFAFERQRVAADRARTQGTGVATGEQLETRGPGSYNSPARYNGA